MSKTSKPSNGAPINNYSGNSKSGWVGYLPDSWVPFIQLARLSPPAGLFLVYFPHVMGILHAAVVQRCSLAHMLYTSAFMLGGSFFVSNALHIWDDLVDAPLDALVERTRYRPIPRGAVTPFAAFLATITQTIGAALFLPLMPGDLLQNTLYGVPSIIGWIYYPMAKRHTQYPQLVLGFCLAYGTVMGSLATTGIPPFTIGKLGNTSSSGPAVSVDNSMLCLFLAIMVWVVIYDTIYAHQDVEDDVKAGIGSLAVRFRHSTKALLSQLLAVMVGVLVACGRISEMGAGYYVLAVGGALTSLGLMIIKVNLKDKASCWWWFGKGFWFAGGSITGGLLAEFLQRVDLIDIPI